MAKSKLSLSMTNILNCVLYAVIGILLLIFKADSLDILFTIVGILFIALGVYDVIMKSLIRGVIEAVIGIVILVCGWTIAEWVLLIFGILLIVKGALDLIQNLHRGLIAWVMPIVTIVLGVLLVVSKFQALDIIFIIAGIIFLVNAVLALFGTSLSKKR